jgi:23S rRNA pseudouridine2605 synthase
MQFFEKMRERLYPVGRLDYMSEGLLLVTNDGELANKLTRASAGVEKTYLVKVAGVPSEAELDILRGGVSIEKGKPGEGRVRTSPARIRQVRHGDNPWYEVVLIEGRNRELRKMFEEIGHFVEKIRRVGYGPLVLDQEPGKLRELDENELTLLRKAADGKLRTPKAKEIRRRNLADSLPPEKPAFRPKSARPSAGTSSGSGDYRGKKSFDRPSSPSGRPARPFVAGKPFAADRDRPARPEAERFRSAGRPAWKKDDRPSRPPARFAEGAAGETRPPQGKTFGERPAAGSTFGAKPGGKPFGERPAARRTFGDKPSGSSFGDKPGRKPFGAKPAPGRSFGAKPAWDKSRGADSRGDFRGKDRPAFKRPAALPREAPEPIEDLGPRKPSRLRIEPINEAERPQRSETGRASYSRPSSNRPSSNRPPQSRDSSLRPFRGEGGLARPFTTSSGKPRAGGARPSSKPGGKSFGAGPGASRGGPRAGGDARPSFGSKRPFSGKPPGRSSSAPRSFRDEQGGASSSRPPRPFTPRSSGPGGGDAFEARPERRTGTGWKPKPSFSRAAKPGSGAPSKSKPGGFSKGGYKGKPSSSSPKRNGPRPGGKRPSGGKKRG